MPAMATAALILAGILPTAPLAARPAQQSQAHGEAVQGLTEPADDYDVPPKAARTTIPEYPRAAYEKGVEGTVFVEVLIDVKGRVTRARVTKSLPELDAAALACVRKWRYIPAQKAGRPVAARAFVVITFKRQGKPNVTAV
jgi:periplasmic protein TonB